MNLRRTLALWPRMPAPPSPDDGDVVFRATSRSHVGRVRAINEDRVFGDCDSRIWVVADGMGGHSAGDVAAEAAISALKHVARTTAVQTEDVEAALQDVNRELHRRTRAGAPMSGATIVVMLATATRASILWAGDCRAYRVRDGEMTQLTRDHSVVQDLIDAGAIRPEDAHRHPQSHVVTRALGAGELLELDCVTTDIAEGDMYLLCSDGLPSDRTALAHAFDHGEGDLDRTADGLLAAALAAGGQDNVSVVLVAPGTELPLRN